ncbi:hypothetical protein H5410_004720 [Solanum commersonii]|uniref:Uncharacterized protein n=1 Tax=Solanum commersonii TaxID=4109 RepID=A0A9J6A4D8_SOLCO|nr:hypothetical protein H5410_004720 [Solanum commersonii]
MLLVCEFMPTGSLENHLFRRKYSLCETITAYLMQKRIHNMICRFMGTQLLFLNHV